MMRKLVLVCAALLASCVTAEPSKEQTATNARLCKSYGYAPGTQQNADCQMKMAMLTMQANQQRLSNAQAAFARMAMTPAPQPVFSPVTFGQPTVVYQPRQPTLSETIRMSRGY